jgi:hypothetical protein
MKIALNSDFRDFYDHWFSLSEEADYTLNRTMVDGILKRDQFKLLEQLGFNTPLHGTPDVLEKQLAEEKTHVVLYCDELAHAGEGKYLHLGNKNFSKHKRYTYASAQIRTDRKADKGCQSTRLLFIGYRKFILCYTSNHSWMSNEGKVSIEFIDEERPRNLTDKWAFTKKWPILAIDYVVEKDTGKDFAIDFNSAPGLSGTPIEEMFSGLEVYQMIEEFVEKEGLTNA